MADADAIVSKRLIISGLTPAIDANKLAQRLSSFGHVHSLVGVGMLDSNGECTFPSSNRELTCKPPGEPRKFVHLTMETTKAKLSRCQFQLSHPCSWATSPLLRKFLIAPLSGMQAFSGSTWKGAKLRLGEAKPDFTERLAYFVIQ